MTIPTNEELLAAGGEMSALNRIVTACTASLQLERVNRLFAARELRMPELKERVSELEQMVRVP